VLLLLPGQSNRRLDKLGVDALSATGADLWSSARRRSIPAKTLLLDQSVLAGVGNIYADEALFLTGIRPTRRASLLTRADCDRLVQAVQQIMRRSIRRGGTTVSDYLDPDGSAGRYQRALQVYGRAGEPCWQCREPIQRLVLAQRSSHFCRKCQK
jgi:formamidopyrimidine-DNA glycosylase